MRSNKSYVKETLAFVNKLRKQAGADPLDDIRTGLHNARSCPVSRSLQGAYTTPYTTCGDHIYLGPITSRRKVQQTRAVRRFVRAFDTGRLPEYQHLMCEDVITGPAAVALLDRIKRLEDVLTVVDGDLQEALRHIKSETARGWIRESRQLIRAATCRTA